MYIILGILTEFNDVSYLVHYLPYKKRPKTGANLKRILRGWRMARGAFGRALVKLKVPDTDVRAGGALV